MTSIRVNLSRLCGRLGLFHYLASTAAIALLGGATLLSQQAAEAADTLSFPPDPTGAILTSGPYSMEIVESPSAINNGDFFLNHLGSLVESELLFGGDPIVGAEAGSMKYFISSTAGNFLTASVDGICLDFGPGNTCSVTKSFTDINDNDLYFSDGSLELTFTNDISATKTFANASQVDQMYVFVTYYSNGTDAQLTSIQDTYQTPGPLPILGAGAAFGFSRKLRGRIKASRQG